MPDENKILIALGLDLTQYETGVSRAAGRTNVLFQAINSVDTELRKIPILGDVYAISLGKIVDGFAEATMQGREFSRIMAVDMKGSLQGSIQLVEEINEALKENRIGSFSRKIADLAKQGVSYVSSARAGESDPQAERDRQALVLQSKRKEVLKEIHNLHKLDATASSEAYSKSIVATENAKADLEFGTAKLKIEQELTATYGPRAAWGKAANKEYAFQVEQAKKLRDAEYSAIGKRTIERDAQAKFTKDQAQAASHGSAVDAARNSLELAQKKAQSAITIEEHTQRDAEVKAAEASLEIEERKFELMKQQEAHSVSSSYEQAAGNTRSAAAEQVRHAKEVLELNRNADAQSKLTAQAQLTIAENQMHAAQIEYEFAKRQSTIDTELLDLQVRGQTRAANQAKIRLDFETRIAEQERRGNVELANNLKLQEKAALLAEEIREYELGGTGRARERQEERRKAQTARIAQTHLDERQRAKERTERGGLSGGGLQSTGLRSGELNHAMLRALKDKPDNRSKQDKFIDTVTEQMGKIVSELSG